MNVHPNMHRPPSSAPTPKMSKIKSAAIIVGGSTAIFWATLVWSGNERFYRERFMPFIQRVFGAETAHNLAIKAAKYGLVPKSKYADTPRLATTVWGQHFTNPVGVAAGFDKHGEAMNGLYKMGFGFVEVGSVTPKPQDGNPKPRVFRLKEDRAVINRYGFNSHGHDQVYNRLKIWRESEEDRLLINTAETNAVTEVKSEGSDVNYTETENKDKIAESDDRVKHYLEPPGWPDERNFLNENFFALWLPKFERTPPKGPRRILGINLGKNKESENAVTDYVEGVHKFGQVADYLVINISSPNTPGLRDLQGKQQLQELIDNVLEARNQLQCKRKPPLLVKIAPDLTEQDKIEIAAVLARPNKSVDGLIISNTTVSRPPSLQSKSKDETGGLSGAPLKELSTQTLRDMYKLTQGRLPIIGVGGVASGEDAYEKIKAGASLVQLYTALSYEGPPIVDRIRRELDELLEKDGYSSVTEAVGFDHRQVPETSSKNGQ
ncbi:dihydroorotate dehydrogenase (quinone), mitochondrial [Lingula anatina]|uniref:Dihydroorotate dehydrogenase (quinone), mitochondrial n=1 Tax=Lingula anatina TaxID=7574 RepID=A0A1S3IAI2_LINAN|nr:dihydroorotate dehydrogenase (quinone), mitochondrial [Lingula anatina]|eukprot:XP_013394866.1 dihydroorotate dehydrogenase (quinone), mitochondrial [Lingula anatina]